jgi:hypothetical protein
MEGTEESKQKYRMMNCPEYCKEPMERLITSHLQTQHGEACYIPVLHATLEVEAIEFMISFPRGGTVYCPVPEC